MLRKYFFVVDFTNVIFSNKTLKHNLYQSEIFFIQKYKKINSPLGCTPKALTLFLVIKLFQNNNTPEKKVIVFIVIWDCSLYYKNSAEPCYLSKVSGWSPVSFLKLLLCGSFLMLCNKMNGSKLQNRSPFIFCSCKILFTCFLTFS